MTLAGSDVVAFYKVQGQIKQMHEEISVLSKKSPDGAINSFKLEFVNELLRDANRLLADSHRPFATFREFNSDNLPTNSDVVVILGQYLDALEAWRSSHVYHEGQWYWKVADQLIAAGPPTRLRIIKENWK